MFATNSKAIPKFCESVHSYCIKAFLILIRATVGFFLQVLLPVLFVEFTTNRGCLKSSVLTCGSIQNVPRPAVCCLNYSSPYPSLQMTGRENFAVFSDFQLFFSDKLYSFSSASQCKLKTGFKLGHNIKFETLFLFTLWSR